MRRAFTCCLAFACLAMSIGWAGTPTLAIASALPTPATTVTLTVAGKNIVLTLPEGTCAYDRAQPVDAKLIGFLEKGNEGLNQVLLAFSDCDDLAALRRGESAGKGYYGQILSEYAKQAMADGSSRGDYVKEMVKEYNVADAEKGANEGKDRVKAAFDDKVEAGDAKMVGIINQEPDFMQAGIIQSVPGADGFLEKIDGIVTITKLGVPVSINLYHTDDNPGAWAALNTQAVSYARKLVALNADSSILHADERREVWNWHEMVEVAALGAAMGGLVALIRRRKRITS